MLWTRIAKLSFALATLAAIAVGAVPVSHTIRADLRHRAEALWLCNFTALGVNTFGLSEERLQP